MFGSVSLAATQAGECIAAPLPTVLFQGDFDAHPDWTGAESATGSGILPGRIRYESDGIPQGWFAFRQTPRWAPSTGFPNGREGVELLSDNGDKAFGNSGKSLVFWRESHTGGFANDKVLAYKLDEPQNQVYVEFMIRFAPNWVPAGLTKLFRIQAWDEANGTEGPFDYFSDGTVGPALVWDYSKNDYGLRNFVALRGGPYGENYYMPTPEGFPRELFRGDASLNLTNNVVGQAPGGANPVLIDKVSGMPIGYSSSTMVTHDQLFGSPSDEEWTKVAFYVQLNSTPNSEDGMFVQWINGERVLYSSTLQWSGPSKEGVTNAGWNIVGLGGNDAFDFYPDEQQYKDWYAIDNLKILDGPPISLSLDP